MKNGVYLLTQDGDELINSFLTRFHASQLVLEGVHQQ